MVETDVDIANDFTNNMLKNSYLTNYSSSITIFFLGIILTGISSVSIINKDSKFQIILFLLAGLSLSYILYTQGLFFANYSGLHDICNSIIQLGELSTLPQDGVGLIKFIGCSNVNIFFQQLMINLVAQNSALKLFNNQMYQLKRTSVSSAQEAFQVFNYLKNLDSSSTHLASINEILTKNENIILDLLSLNKCNLIKHWVFEAQENLCLNASKGLLYMFWIFCLLVVAFFCLIISANQGAKILENKNYLDILKKHTYNKEKYNNEFKLT